ncbi:uncharacterized protein TNCV_1272561 [Trichonephila clavipes]|nr:uncharacterized protein TNCV_1272561 [Trichonephila clavipes]
MSIKTLYKVINSSSDIVVRCPICFESMTFGHYYHQHALQEHFLKHRKECVFCMGLKSWPHEQAMNEQRPTYVGFYDSVFEKPDMWPRGLEFSEASGLGKDVHGILQRYLSQDMERFHIMVKHDAFPIFCREMETIRDEFVLLPFWCLCDDWKVKYNTDT